jgi:hypothetical protein
MAVLPWNGGKFCVKKIYNIGWSLIKKMNNIKIKMQIDTKKWIDDVLKDWNENKDEDCIGHLGPML